MDYTLNANGCSYKGSEKDGILEFLGIRYAKPVGFWEEPEIMDMSGAGQVHAQEYAGVCLQPFEKSEPSSLDKKRQSNDCLTLNIWTKKNDKTKKPVMVYIHGGSFVNGSNNDLTTGGEQFLRNIPEEEDAVMININYRLGIFGCLDLSVLEGYDDQYRRSSVLWILDQLTALQWVHDNVEAFGGDPDNVTIFGQSAGSISVAFLMVCEQAKGLFRRGIMESGIPFFGTSTKEEKRRFSAELLTELGITSVEELTAKDDAFWREKCDWIFENYMDRVSQRAADGEYIPENFYGRICSGETKDIDLMVGATTGEMDGCTVWYKDLFRNNPKQATAEILSIPFQPAGFATDTISFLGEEQKLAEYINGKTDKLKATTDVMNYFMNQLGSRLYAKAQSKWNAHTWLYFWNWMPDPSIFMKDDTEAVFSLWNRAPHCAELPVVFGSGEWAYSSFNRWWLEPYEEHLASKPSR